MLHVIKGLGRGGAETLLASWIRTADPLQVAYDCAYLVPWKDALVGEIEAGGSRVVCLSSGRAVDLPLACWRLVRLIRDWRPELVHAHLPVAGVVARLAGAVTRVPVVYTEHNVNERYASATRLANRLTWGLNTVVVAVSAEVAASIEAVLGRRSRPAVRVIRNGIDTERFASVATLRAGARHALGIAPDAAVVGTVAVFRAQKRLDLWIEVARRVREVLPEARFLLAGDGPLRSALEAQAAALGLGESVHFVGLQEDVRPYLAAMDVFLISSDFEGLPLAPIEAMAAGRPVVATAAGGLPELFAGWRVGGAGATASGYPFVVSPGDLDGLTRLVLELLADPARAAAVGAASREHVSRRFGLEAMTRAYEEVYAACLHGRGRGPVRAGGAGR